MNIEQGTVSGGKQMSKLIMANPIATEDQTYTCTFSKTADGTSRSATSTLDTFSKFRDLEMTAYTTYQPPCNVQRRAISNVQLLVIHSHTPFIGYSNQILSEHFTISALSSANKEVPKGTTQRLTCTINGLADTSEYLRSNWIRGSDTYSVKDSVSFTIN